jgi:nucleoside diphosphate kinase
MTTSIGFDIFAKDTASAKFDKLGNTIDDTSTKADKMGRVFKMAALGLVAGAGVAAVALVGMTKSAIEDEAAQQKLALGLKNATDATDAQVAAAEKWITAQGNALGVTDDELRPALQRLAQSTGDVGKAQEQLQIAMDISAGSGKSLASVTEAMMKANNGSIGGLGRLGIATKNAAGETLSLEQIMAKAADTFEGQAAAKADTLSGKMDILKLRFDEAKETIGATLIPVLTTLAGWILDTGVPAVERFAEVWRESIGSVVAAFKADGLAGVVTKVEQTLTDALPMIEQKMAQWGKAFTAWVGPMIPPLLAALGKLLVKMVGWAVVDGIPAMQDAMGRMGVAAMRGLINGIGDKLGDLGDKIGSAKDRILNKFVGAFDWLMAEGRQIIGGLIGGMGERFEDLGAKITAAKDRIVNKFVGATEWLLAEGRQIIGGLIGGIGEKFEELGTKVGSIKEKVTGALAGASTWLYSAGAELVQGLINGITSKIAALASKMKELADKVKGFLPGSPVKEGPLTSWNNGGAGKRLVGLLADGMSDTRPVDAAMNKLASHANVVGSGSMAIGATGFGSSAAGPSMGAGDTYHVTIVSNDPHAVVDALYKYVKSNGKLRGVTV